MILVGRGNWCRELFKTFSRPNTIYLNFGNRKQPSATTFKVQQFLQNSAVLAK
jgi:hypothetical protein